MSYLGHIVLNNRITYGKNKKNVTYYAFKSYKNENENVMIIPYKKESKEDQTNVYVLASINENNTNH